MDHKIEIKKDPWCLTGTFTGIKSETEDTLVSYYNVTKSNTVICNDMSNKMKIKEEPLVLPESASWNGVELENSFSHCEDDTTELKMEIKEEPWWLERSSADVDNNTRETEEMPALYSPAKETSRSFEELTYRVSDNATRSETSDYNYKGVCLFENSVINTSEFLNGTQTHKECTVTNNSDDSAVKPSSFSQCCKRPNKCDTNKKSSSNSSRLKSHKSKYQTERPHKCDICEESFVALSNLKLHKLIHEIKREYTCEICKQSFKHFWQLKRHFARHTYEKNSHKCAICKNTFADVSHLKDHKLTGACKRSFKCEICVETFTRSSNLKRHILIHKGKGDIKCEICEKTFSRLTNLRNHKFIHEDKKPHECEICKKTFITMSHLRRHKLGHDGKTPK